MNTAHSQPIPRLLSFDGADIEIVDHCGQPWLTSGDIGRALGYESERGRQFGAPLEGFDAGKLLLRLYRRHLDEFTDDMTMLVELPTAGGMQKVRIFSPRGCHLIAMFARTPKAKAFRRWVLDVLDQLGQRAPEPKPLALPSPLPVRPVSAFAGLVFKAVGPILDMERWTRLATRDVGRMAGTFQDTARRALGELCEAGLLERQREHETARTWLYRLRVPYSPEFGDAVATQAGVIPRHLLSY